MIEKKGKKDDHPPPPKKKKEKKFCKLAFIFLFTHFRKKGFLTDTRLLIVSLFENRLFSYSVLSFTRKN